MKAGMVFNPKEFIDIHTHILPGLDDGASDMTEALEMARLFERAGIGTVVATPHFVPGTAWAASKEKVLQTLKTLQIKVEEQGIQLNILPGMEIAFHKNLEERLVDKTLLPLGNSDYYLIEPSFHGEQDGLLSVVNKLLDKGEKLILAHPERIEGLSSKTSILQKLVTKGLLLQINGGSCLGYFGKKSKKLSEEFEQLGCPIIIASDSHNTTRRPPLKDEELLTIFKPPEGERLFQNCSKNLSKVFI